MKRYHPRTNSGDNFKKETLINIRKLRQRQGKETQTNSFIQSFIQLTDLLSSIGWSDKGEAGD